MPRSLLLPLVAVFALAACSKQADTGAAPAPETAEAADTAAVVGDTLAPADTTLPAEEPAMEEPAMEEPVPAEEPVVEDTMPVEEPAPEDTMPVEEPAAEIPADTTMAPTDTTVPLDSVPSN